MTLGQGIDHYQGGSKRPKPLAVYYVELKTKTIFLGMLLKLRNKTCRAKSYPLECNGLPGDCLKPCFGINKRRPNKFKRSGCSAALRDVCRFKEAGTWIDHCRLK